MKKDGSGSPSFAIRGIPSSIRPTNRHSGEGRNPGGEGCGNDTRTLPLTNASNLHTLVCRHPPAWAIPIKACPGLRSGIASRLVTPAVESMPRALMRSRNPPETWTSQSTQ